MFSVAYPVYSVKPKSSKETNTQKIIKNALFKGQFHIFLFDYRRKFFRSEGETSKPLYPFKKFAKSCLVGRVGFEPTKA